MSSIEKDTVKDLKDEGLEAFLHLLSSDIDLPKADVEPNKISLRLDKGEIKQIPLQIRNEGRGYLAGTIEFSDNLPGLELDSHQFGLNTKTQKKIIINLRVDTKFLESGRQYQTTLIFWTNGKPEKIPVSLSIQTAERKKRAQKAMDFVLKFGLFPAIPYWILVLELVGRIFGIGSLNIETTEPNVLVLELSIFVSLLLGIWLPPLLFLIGRNPKWYVWLYAIVSCTFIASGLDRASSAGTPEIAWAFFTIVLFAFIPLLMSAFIARTLYYRSPHLPGFFTSAITLGVFALFAAILALYSFSSWQIAQLDRQQQQDLDRNDCHKILMSESNLKNLPDVSKKVAMIKLIVEHSNLKGAKYLNIKSVLFCTQKLIFRR